MAMRQAIWKGSIALRIELAPDQVKEHWNVVPIYVGNICAVTNVTDTR